MELTEAVSCSKISPDGSQYDIPHSFTYQAFNAAANMDGFWPKELTGARSGTIYGVTALSGDAIQPYLGSIFELNQDGNGFRRLHGFENLLQDGDDPETILTGEPGALLEGTDGFLHGTTSDGGTNVEGIVFKLNEAGTSSIVLHNFGEGRDGAYPWARLIQGSDGALYGTTTAGGAGNDGIVFTINTNGTSYRVLHSFTNEIPLARLLEGRDGALHGTTSPTANGNCVAFGLNKDGNGYRADYPQGFV
jgi:uncharacterized repeat protein (TIGR03803 family)